MLIPVRWLIHDGDIQPVFRSSLRVNLVTGAWWQNSFFHINFDLRFIVLKLSSDNFCLNQLPLIVFDKFPSSNSFGFCLRRIAASLCLSISLRRNFVIYSFSLRWHEAIEAALQCVEVLRIDLLKMEEGFDVYDFSSPESKRKVSLVLNNSVFLSAACRRLQLCSSTTTQDPPALYSAQKCEQRGYIFRHSFLERFLMLLCTDWSAFQL